MFIGQTGLNTSYNDLTDCCKFNNHSNNSVSMIAFNRSHNGIKDFSTDNVKYRKPR